jgi:hypothetical protein
MTRLLWSAARRPLALSLLAGVYGATLGLAGWAGYTVGTRDHPTLARAWAQTTPSLLYTTDAADE